MNSQVTYSESLKSNFDTIYVTYFLRMKRFAKEYVLFDEDAENIVQDVFVMLWEKREVLDIQVSLLPYMFMLVKNRCLDFLRHQEVAEEYRQELETKRSALEIVDCEFSSEEDLERVVNEAIDNLPERCREIFLKSRLEGMKYKEIAESMNLSVNTVENQMAIALKKLRIELKDYLPFFLFLM